MYDIYIQGKTKDKGMRKFNKISYKNINIVMSNARVISVNNPKQCVYIYKKDGEKKVRLGYYKNGFLYTRNKSKKRNKGD